MMKNKQGQYSTHNNHFGKKLFAAVLIGGSLLSLSACGMKKGAEVKVSSGTYVVEDDKTPQNGHGYLALKVNVKNTTGQTIDISSDDFKLKQGDKTISPESLYIDGMHNITSEKLDKDDSTSGYVYFKVNKKDKYDLKFSPEADDSEKDDNLKATTSKVDASKYKDPGESAKKAAKDYVKAVFLNDKKAQDNNNLANNVKEDEKDYQKDFKKGLIGDLDEGKVSDQQADKVFQDYVTDGAKRDTITYKVREADANNATIEIVAKNVNIGDMDFDQLSSNFEKDFMNKHKNDDDINEDEVESEAAKYVLDKLPGMISKAEVSTDDDSGYQLKLTKKDGKWEVMTTGSDSYGYTSLRNQFLAGLDSF